MRGQYNLRTHRVLENPIYPPFPENLCSITVGMGCFWGGERVFWRIPGVFSTFVGYAGGSQGKPTGTSIKDHTEVVRVIYDPSVLTFDQILDLFWTSHPAFNESSRRKYRSCLLLNSNREINQAILYKRKMEEKYGRSLYTDIELCGEFHYADDHHQQYHAQH